MHTKHRVYGCEDCCDAQGRWVGPHRHHLRADLVRWCLSDQGQRTRLRLQGAAVALFIVQALLGEQV